MPGTILVSVLELMDLPFSSPSSTISIKVSMGKKEYQTWDKGELSFPLTTLRDNLVVVIQDSEGNEISHAGVETKLIVEKGIWDDIFPLEGGGHVQMKLQFVLNEDERNRIRLMRESAMKKKHGELLDCRTSSVEVSPSDHTKVASSSCHENSDRNKEATSSAIPLSQDVDHIHISRLIDKQSDEEVEPQLLSAKIASREDRSNESPSSMGSSESGSYSRKRSSLERIPSSVRNMISAFESNLSQDTKSHIKPSPPAKVQSNKIGSQSKEAKTENTETMRGSVQLEELSTTKVRGKGANNTSTKSKLKFTHKELATEEEKSHGDSTRTSMITTSSAVDNVSDKQHSSKSQTKISPETSPSSTMREITTHYLRPVEHYEDMHDSFDSFGAWIFPDQMRRFCVTTGGKKLMDFVGRYGSIKSEVRQRKVNFSIPEKSNDDGGTRNDIKRSKKTHKARKSKPESEDVKSSTGPVGQLMKVAIMVGFGVLVLLTRQRNNR